MIKTNITECGQISVKLRTNGTGTTRKQLNDEAFSKDMKLLLRSWNVVWWRGATQRHDGRETLICFMNCMR
jgi:hypothetical protein